MKSRAEFIFVDAPVIADPEPVVVDLNDTSDRGVGRTWWTWQVGDCLFISVSI